MARKKRSECAAQVEMLHESLKSIDANWATYPLWTRLTAFLVSMCAVMDDLKEAVRGDGNGSRGLLERVTVIESKVNVAQSDIREVLNTLRAVYGMDHDGLPIKYGENNHPGRRKEDNGKIDPANTILRYFTDKILPAIITWAILGYLAFQIAVNQQMIIAK